LKPNLGLIDKIEILKGQIYFLQVYLDEIKGGVAKGA
jgi:hypothetical protein